ncbi:GNAT family N-acetyltransferase [Mycetocola lacteus]|uniref:GNAT family N-acetyltransferase n=1 Tax=Mycetocola lacteus TaxID=76637 RepID=A0A3L7AQG1_9MICO|nr:GNAT family N-acetyltransferase [Mycetocola lacteus]RLP82354.1 GNAT family N-acetyltransferase [Mycetocola lacteus]
MTLHTDYLRAYDQQLRTTVEVRTAESVFMLGGLTLAIFPGGHGFVTYAKLDATPTGSIAQNVNTALAYFATYPEIVDVEWKTRAHDDAPGLHTALTRAGFVAQESESVMIGALEDLLVNDPTQALAREGITVRRITTEAEVRAMSAMSAEAFGEEEDSDKLGELLSELAIENGTEFWVAQAAQRIVSAGRLEPVPGTDFVGIWGGSTLHAYRGRGIYRALTAARARSALASGKRFVHSDSTEFSRPILERSGLIRVTQTTPYLWER